MSFVPDSIFFQEEMRDGFFVSEKMKKVWYTEINLLQELDRVCRKYGLRYFADYGALLGAVRHKGFIPWDDDIDVTMLRGDYEKLKEVASDEFKEPYFYQDSYTDSMIWAFSKLRDSRTTALEFPDFDSDFNQGIFIDIFPLDDVIDEHEVNKRLYIMKREMWKAIVDEKGLLEEIESGKRFLLPNDILTELLSMPIRERMKQFEAFCNMHTGVSENVDFITGAFTGQAPKKSVWYRDVVYLPFEYIQIPAPIDYDLVLKGKYGNYHEIIRGNTMHDGIVLEPDIPYKVYMENYIRK